MLPLPAPSRIRKWSSLEPPPIFADLAATNFHFRHDAGDAGVPPGLQEGNDTGRGVPFHQGRSSFHRKSQQGSRVGDGNRMRILPGKGLVRCPADRPIQPARINGRGPLPDKIPDVEIHAGAGPDLRGSIRPGLPLTPSHRWANPPGIRFANLPSLRLGVFTGKKKW